MRAVYTFIFLFFAALGFAQNTGTIEGSLLDLESNNQPLNMAKVSIKGLASKTYSDDNGHFKFDALKPGTYTLVSHFPGYDAKEITVEVKPEVVNKITVSMAASTLSLEDLVSMVSAEQNTSASSSR